jgi:hypothetical protein
MCTPHNHFISVRKVVRLLQEQRDVNPSNVLAIERMRYPLVLDRIFLQVDKPKTLSALGSPLAVRVLIPNVETRFNSPERHRELRANTNVVEMIPTKGISESYALTLAACTEHGFKRGIEIIPNSINGVHHSYFEFRITCKDSGEKNYLFLEVIEGGHHSRHVYLPKSKRNCTLRGGLSRRYRSMAMRVRNRFLRCCVNPPICEALAADLLKHRSGALLIVNAERLTVVVTEVELVNVALQMLLAHALVDAGKARLRIEKKPSAVFVVTLPRTYS